MIISVIDKVGMLCVRVELRLQFAVITSDYQLEVIFHKQRALRHLLLLSYFHLLAIDLSFRYLLYCKNQKEYFLIPLKSTIKTKKNLCKFIPVRQIPI